MLRNWKKKNKPTQSKGRREITKEEQKSMKRKKEKHQRK